MDAAVPDAEVKQPSCLGLLLQGRDVPTAHPTTPLIAYKVTQSPRRSIKWLTRSAKTAHNKAETF